MAKTVSTSHQQCALLSNSASTIIALGPFHIAKRFGTLTLFFVFCTAHISATAQEFCANKPTFSTEIFYDRNGRPMVQAEVAGRDRYLLLDTGGAKSILDPGSAEELGLRVGQFGPPSESLFDRGSVAPREEYIDVTGRRSSSFTVVDDLRLGEQSFGPHEFIISPIGQNQDDRFSPIGTLGAEFMMGYDVAFDFDSDVFQLFAQNQCDSPPFLEDGDGAASVAVPFTFNRSNHINFSLRLDGQTLMAVLDTGAHDTILSLPVAQRVFSIDLDSPDIIQTGELEGRGIANMYRRRFASLQIETLLLVDPMIFLLPDLMAPSATAPAPFDMLSPMTEEVAALPDFILGMSVLDRYRLFISYGRRTFYLSPLPIN